MPNNSKVLANKKIKGCKQKVIFTQRVLMPEEMNISFNN
jgi:hypothetical protein